MSEVTRRQLLSSGVMTAFGGCLGQPWFSQDSQDPLKETKLVLGASRQDIETIRGTFVRPLDDLEEVREREAYEEAIRNDIHFATFRPRRPRVLFVESDGTYHRVDWYKVDLYTGSGAYVLKTIRTYSDVATALRSLVGLAIVPICEEVLPETLEAFETAVRDGEYVAEPMTEMDCKALERMISGFANVLELEWSMPHYWYEGGLYRIGVDVTNGDHCPSLSRSTLLYNPLPRNSD